MMITFTVNNIGTGGAERVVCNIANQMAKEGHIVRIVCYEKLQSFYYELEERVSIIELDPMINRRDKRWKRKLAGIFNLWRLFKAVEGSDCVVSFYSRQNCYSILVCKLRGIPIICSERDHFFLSDGKINYILRKLFYPHADGFIHQTQMVREYLRENAGVVCEDTVIPNPLWINTYPQREPVKGRIVAVGRLAEQKNYEGMLRAFKFVFEKYPHSRLYIYGAGDKSDLEILSRDLGMSEGVYFAGMTKDVIEAYRRADIFVMFSHGEGYPNALMEALAIGVPSISSDCPVGGPKDMITDGNNGFLVPCGDEKALADRLCILMTNQKLRDKFSANSIQIRETNRFELIYNLYLDYILKVKTKSDIKCKEKDS
ncbi:TPA: glycosyltransferase [Streptococcus suis]|nr:glycosyltransferase [Streptococcus suis]